MDFKRDPGRPLAGPGKRVYLFSERKEDGRREAVSMESTPPEFMEEESLGAVHRRDCEKSSNHFRLDEREVLALEVRFRTSGRM